MIAIYENKTCLECGNEWQMLHSQTKGGRGKFCSRSCQGKYRQRNEKILKPNIKPNKTTWKSGDNLADKHPRWIEPLKFICEFCKSEFTRKPWIVRQNGVPRFCGKECFAKFKKKFESGANAPDYVGGAQTYRGRKWKKIRLTVVSEQKECCAVCGKFVGKSLPVHHIKPFREFASVEKANQRKNLIGMCQSCHMKNEPRNYFRMKRADYTATAST